MNSLSNFQIPDVWEVKDVINKVKNVVLNYTEMEAKVHEATNNEQWGASNTLMQEIAQGTYNYQYFNEIMPTIYKRFTEKEPKQWRQIYKALVLLEYLIKNGTERVIDDARSHVSTVKIMRNFYYIDDRGKDEGINVRNRAKDIVELLSNTDKVRSERKLAKKNQNKYTGIGSDTGNRGFSSSSSMGSGISALSKYVGFGSDSYNNRGISFNGDAMSYGEEKPYPHQSGKYDEDEDEFGASAGGYHSDSNNSPANRNTDTNHFTDDDDFGSYSSNNNNVNKNAATSASNDDDWGDFACGSVAEKTSNATKSNTNILDGDFADFQHAAENKLSKASISPQKTKKPDLFDLLGDESSVSSPPLHQSLSGFNSQPLSPSFNNKNSLGYQQNQKTPVSSPAPASAAVTPAPATTGMWAQASGFVSLDGLGKKNTTAQPARGPSINALKQTSVSADWNNWASNNQGTQKQQQQQQANKSNSAFDDLLL